MGRRIIMVDNKKVLLLSKYARLGASSRLRSLQYIPYLEAHGFDVTVQSLFDDRFLTRVYETGRRPSMDLAAAYLRRALTLMSLHRYDLVWIEYEVFPYFFSLVERSLGRAYVVDYDDAVFHNYDLSRNPVVKRCLGRKIDRVMCHAGCVIAGNGYLASRARHAGAPHVEVIPTVVDPGRYAVRPVCMAERPVIGWIGSPATQGYIMELGEVLRRVCGATRARLLLVGASSSVATELPGIDVEIHTWREASEADLIRRMDIGIMPLSNGPWERGKCGYKLIQYMACGVPVVASRVGANTDIVEGSRAGLLAASPMEWESALRQLLESPTRRDGMGRAGRRVVESTYSLHVQAPRLSELLTRAIANSGRRSTVADPLR